MASGFSSVQEAGRDIAARKTAAESGDFPKRLFFRLPNDGDTAVVRFLEENDDVQWAWIHERDGTYPLVCRDQDEEGRRIGETCPGCDTDMKRKFRGVINVIWRDVEGIPRYNKVDGKLVPLDEDGDVVSIWISGSRLFVDTLDPVNKKYGGLSSRDFEVTRRGNGFDTAYSVLPADPDGGKTPLSEADKALEAEKNDLSYYVDPPALDEWGKTKDANKTQVARQPLTESPFRSKAKASVG